MTRRFLSSYLLASTALAGCALAPDEVPPDDVVAIAPSENGASSCLVTRRLPCAVTIGQTFGAYTVRTADDSEEAVEAVLAHVFGTAPDVRAVGAPLVSPTATPIRDDAASSLAWSYGGDLGTAAAPAYLTVTSDRGFAIFPVFGMPAGTATLADAPIARARLWQTTTSQCRAVTPVAVHGTVAGNARLARIEDGRVPCMHADDGTVTECAFGSATGSWLEGADGDYALAGQALGEDGEPGGAYVVAARVGHDGTVPCVDPRRWRDTAGTSISRELARTCVVETLLSASNASGLPLDNHATLEVCSSDAVHPDGATRTRQASATSFCYTGRGAALNDINGTERDEYGNYYPDANHCHEAWISGVGAPAAKRPATRSFPAPGSVRTDTPIVWRPVINSIRIAN